MLLITKRREVYAMHIDLIDYGRLQEDTDADNEALEAGVAHILQKHRKASEIISSDTSKVSASRSLNSPIN